jgi:hypothetical protein
MSLTSSPAAVPDARLEVEVGPRGLPALHRDTWRTVARLPVLLFLLPALIWFPFDLLAEAVSMSAADDALAQLRRYNQVNRITTFLVGGWVNAFVLVGVLALGRGEDASIGAAFGRAKQVYGNVLITTWSVGWRVGLGTLLFIVPGVVLAVRYALALPVTVREGLSGRAAVEASSAYTEGHRWRIFGYATFAVFVYVVLAMVPLAVLPDTSVLWNTVTTIPFNLIAAGLTVGSALLYIEIIGDAQSAPPVGRVARGDVLHAKGEPRSGVLGVVFVSVTAALLVLVAVVGIFFLVEEEIEEPAPPAAADIFE